MSTGVPALPLVVQVEQLLITANGRLVLSVEQAGGTPYTGYLDHDQLVLPLGVTDFRKGVVQSGPCGSFFVNDGSLAIAVDGAGLRGDQLADGIYIARFRPRGSDGPFSNQIGYTIDRAARPVSEDVDNNGGRYIVPQPVAGAYVVYRDQAADGSLNGYTRIEFEAQDDNAEIVQRFTKTASTAYWGPSGNPADQNVATLRWRIGPSSTNAQNFKALVGFLSRFDRTNVVNTSLAYTRYSEDDAGNLGRVGAGQTVAAFVGPSPLFYTLAPVHLFPETLSDDFVPIIDRLVSYDAAGVFNNWHVEVRASQLGGMYEVRYVEWALGVADLSARPQFDSTPSASVDDWGLFFRWSVLEDWDWNADGTLNRITQRGNSRAHTAIEPDDLVPDCWRVPGGCDKSNRHDLRPLRRYVPDRRARLLQWVATTFPGWEVDRLINYVADHFNGMQFMPLHIGFVDAEGNEVSTLTIAPDEPWTLRVLTADDEPYDGFLQVRQPSGKLEVWADQRGFPIYVHDGQVEVLPEAFAYQSGMTIVLEMRQQLLNEHIAADIMLTERAQPNDDALPFSNRIQLEIRQPLQAAD